MVLMCLGLMGGGIWLTLAFTRLSEDVGRSQERIPRPLAASLAPSTGILDGEQVTLVAPLVPATRRVAPILLRTDPTRDVIGLLELPTIPSSALVETVDRTVGSSVNHAVLVDFRSIRPLVDRLGGIVVDNPRPVNVVARTGVPVLFPEGRLELDGAGAASYVTAAGNGADIRRQAVLRGVVQGLIRFPTLRSLSETVQDITAAVATDLAASDVLGLAWLRFESTGLVWCDASRLDPSAASYSPMVRAFSGRIEVRPRRLPPSCKWIPLDAASVPLPPDVVARALTSHPLFVAALVTSAGLLGLFGVALFAIRRRSTTASPRGELIPAMASARDPSAAGGASDARVAKSATSGSEAALAGSGRLPAAAKRNSFLQAGPISISGARGAVLLELLLLCILFGVAYLAIYLA